MIGENGAGWRLDAGCYVNSMAVHDKKIYLGKSMRVLRNTFSIGIMQGLPAHAMPRTAKTKDFSTQAWPSGFPRNISSLIRSSF